MSIGNKIKALRKKRGMTQATLSDGIVTRGMLSQIESGQSMPSMHSLYMLADRLNVSPSFLLEDGDDILPAEYARIVKTIEKEYKAKNYKKCLDLFSHWQLENDDRFLPIFVVCAFECAKLYFKGGEFVFAFALLEKVKENLPKLLISPHGVSEKQIDLLISLINNIENMDTVVDTADVFFDLNSPISVFFELLMLLKNGKHNECRFVISISNIDGFYKEYIDVLFMINDYKFIDAIIKLKSLLANDECPVFLKLLCLSSIENCCKLCEDYKGAYENHLARSALLASINR